MPGETVAIDGDALNRLADRATHFYVGSGRYRYGTQPGVRRLAGTGPSAFSSAPTTRCTSHRQAPLPRRPRGTTLLVEPSTADRQLAAEGAVV